jgi:hypothetical protein
MQRLPQIPNAPEIQTDFSNETSGFEGIGDLPGLGKEVKVPVNKDLAKYEYNNPSDKNANIKAPEYYGIKGKAKNQRSFDGEAAVNVFNAGAQGVLGMIDRRQKGKQEGQMMENEFNADNLYATSTDRDRGDWVDYGSQLGQYRFDQMGQDRSGRFSYGQEGGYMQEGGFTEGEEVEMTEAELADFIANGGEVEYI